MENRGGDGSGTHRDTGVLEGFLQSKGHFGASTDSSTNRTRYGGWDFAAVADFHLVRAAVDAADALGVETKLGLIHSADLFYDPMHTFDGGHEHFAELMLEILVEIGAVPRR